MDIQENSDKNILDKIYEGLNHVVTEAKVFSEMFCERQGSKM